LYLGYLNLDLLYLDHIREVEADCIHVVAELLLHVSDLGFLWSSDPGFLEVAVELELDHGKMM